MAIGELAYWPPGNAFCIFFGPTPVSCGNEPRAANPCNPLGQILDDIAPLLEAQDGVNVQVHLALITASCQPLALRHCGPISILGIAPV